MSHTNFVNSSNNVKDSCACIPEVEIVSCKSCDGLKKAIKGKTLENENEDNSAKIEGNSNQTSENELKQKQKEENSAKIKADISPKVKNIFKSLVAMKNALGENKKIDQEIVKFVEAMVDDLEEIAGLKVTSYAEVDRILKEVDDELNMSFNLITDNKQYTNKPEDNSSKKSNCQESATAKFIEILQKGNTDCIINCLNGLSKIQAFKNVHFVALNCAVEGICNKETLLHISFKFDQTTNFAYTLMDTCPKLLLKDRKDRSNQYKTGFEGQTPLHVAIVRKSNESVKRIIHVGKKEEILTKLLKTVSEGTKFDNTVLIGQLPLTVAALACKNKNFMIMDTLLASGAKIWWPNKHGDTVFHSLIKYADIYPEKISHIQATFEFLWEKYSKPEKHVEDESKAGNKTKINSKMEMEKKPAPLLLRKNKSGLTPLHLSAKLGVSQLFDNIVNKQYRFTNIQDGLFDIREYDVTEFDRLINYMEKSQNKKKITVLERLFDPKCSHKEAFELLNQELIAFILHKKWMAYRLPLLLWMILHLLFMIVFTASIIIKAEVIFCSELNQTSGLCDRSTSEALVPPLILFILVMVIDFLFGVSYLIAFGLCIKKLIERCFCEDDNFGLIYHNLDYVICFLVVGVGALMEVCLIPLRMHWDVHLFLVLLFGWYFMLFFSPFSKNLVSFTHMIKKGFLEDFLPFGLVFLYLLFSFTGMMHMLFLGTEEKVDAFYTFEDSLLSMFNLGVGLNNIDVLNESRVPWLAYTVFVVFAVLSFIHLFNAFIAVMSQTFSDVHTDKHSYLKYNKLRMIELFEDIVLIGEGLPGCRSFLEKAKHWKSRENYEKDENHENDISNGTSNDNTINGDDGESKQRNETKGLIYSYDKKRFYTVIHQLNDHPNNDNDEREDKRKGPVSKLKSFYKIFKLGKSSRISKKRNRNPRPPDITYIQLDYTNRATQFPDIK